MDVNLVEVASDEPLSVDGTVFGLLPLPKGLPKEGVVSEGELVGEPAVQFGNIYRTTLSCYISHILGSI